jgi:ATP-binding cassette subfamily B protein/subfamily B ATP-binding cassette protein MsbA
MNNFARALRLALQYRLVFATSVLCALLVAVLWGGNIGTVYPFVEVVFRGQSLQQKVDDEIQEAERKIAELSAMIGQLEPQLAKAPVAQQKGLEHRLREAQIERTNEQHALAGYRRVRPYVYRYLPNDPFRTLVLIVAMLMAGTVIKSLFLVAHTVLVGKLASLATFDLRKQFYRRTLRMDLSTFGNDGTGELMSRFTYDMESVAAGLNSLFGKAVREPLKMIVCLAGAAWVCWRLLLLSLLIAPLAAFLVGKLGKLLKRANRRAMEEMSQIYSILEETFLGIKAVKAFTMERSERRRFHEYNKKYYHKSMRIARYDSLTHPVTEMMGIATICLAIIAGAYLVLNEETHLLGIRMSDRPLDFPTLLLFFGLLSGVSDPARKMSEIFSRIQRAAAASDRIYSLIDREPAVRDPKQPQRLPRHRREIRFENVDFSYVPGKPVIEQINLTVPFGETIALVGPNGCGKSTLVNLIPRFFDPVHGRVTIDGIDLCEVRLRHLRSQIGLVTQETLLFDDTVFNNIRYGSPSATPEQVIEAAKQAHAHRFIETRLENGYDTIVGPQGSFLSGGQRQRISLARAILRDPTILILDEATSQVDLESEQLIHKVLEQFVRNRTTFIITHRMSTLALADRIVVMSQGRMIDIGTHEQLLRQCDVYRRLHDIQFREIA